MDCDTMLTLSNIEFGGSEIDAMCNYNCMAYSLNINKSEENVDIPNGFVISTVTIPSHSPHS